MLERFLVPLDGSPVAEAVLPTAATLARRLDQPITLLAVIDTADLLRPMFSDQDALLVESIELQSLRARHYLEAVRERLAASGVRTSTEVEVGGVAARIDAAARATGSGLIAMTTHGRSGLERWFLGSVADSVVRTARVPVLLVRPGTAPLTDGTGVKRIVLPLDGSEASEAAIPYAALLAKAFDAPAVLVRSVPAPAYAWGEPTAEAGATIADLLSTMVRDAQAYLEQAAARLEREGLVVEIAPSQERPAAAVVEQAERTPGSIIVMSSHGRTGVVRTVLGSVADQVIRSAAAPVLLVRPLGT